MAIFHSNAIPAGSTGYDIEKSLRFNDDDSPYLTWTPGSSGTQTKFTISFWYKIASTGSSVTRRTFFSAGTSVHNEFVIGQGSGGTGDDINIQGYISGSGNFELTTNRKFRDSTNWYHVVVAVDTSQGTASNKLKLYINGVEETSFATDGRSSMGSNQIVNSNVPHRVGQFARVGGHYMDGYIAEFHSVENQQLTPSDFGVFDEDYGHWKPKKYSGSHGSNGFYLDFKNSGTKHTVTASGNAQHSTTEKKMGASSMKFDGSGDYLTISDHTDFDFGTGNYTIEFWIYPTALADYKRIFSSSASNHAGNLFNLHASGNAQWLVGNNSGSWISNCSGPSNVSVNNWYHVAGVRNGTTTTLYLNGVGGTAASYSGSAGDTNASAWNIGYWGLSGEYFTGYIDEVRISNTARYTSNFTPSTSAFTEDANTVLLIHSDTTNGSTAFTDSSGVTGGPGNDASANSNHFTPTNLAASDQVTDTPTNNFPVMNNLNNQPFATTFAEGNLQITTGGSGQEPGNMATMGMSSGKWYFEVYQKGNGSNNALIGIRGTQAGINGATDNPGRVADGYGFYGLAGYQNIVNNNAYTEYGTRVEYTDGDVVSVAVDLDNNKCYWAVNGTYINSGNPAGNSNGLSITAVASTTLGEYFPCIGDYDANSYVLIANFGQDGTFAGNVTAGGNADGNGYGNFKHSVPTNFKALCSANLPEPAVVPSEHFIATIRSGNNNQAVTGFGFQPDLIWSKTRTATHNWQCHDAVRGATAGVLNLDISDAESSSFTLDSFDSDGFTIDSGNIAGMNGSGNNYVTYGWKMNGSGSSNSNGSTTSTVSANTSAGQSIVTYSGSSGNDTVGHGLSQAPNLVIVKSRANADQWRVGSIQNIAGTTMDFTDYLKLNDTTALTDESTTWVDTAPTSTVFSVGSDSATNHPGYTYVSYCFYSVEGFSKIGGYQGVSDADGAFIYTGFRPAMVIIKNITQTGNHWVIFDSARTPDNPSTKFLFPSDNAVENTSNGNNLDFLSNGIKFRKSDGWYNHGNYKYLYMAFAEQPFKYSIAR